MSQDSQSDQLNDQQQQEEEYNEEEEEEEEEFNEEEEEIKKTLDDELLDSAINRDFNRLKLLLIEKGANAFYNKRIEGVWGAYEEYGVIHKVLLGWDDMKEQMQAIELLLSKGANVNAIYGSNFIFKDVLQIDFKFK
ncbi:predicted protein [Naegleria gruberi]|uniref:Predicted protein n=1 Tax=Naegleria gruberi TaxID=5762 RepID=D2W5Y6_NAEGR|nr:uncharacterized protein NAEGRDRAFT_76830 [Naegleria gruberi]EFC35515.1 predicted protein [Naegleria gruberi]|eukprot:XP_002668259.1 predicted protein [Naegleria gruberi strain NEG-M]